LFIEAGSLEGKREGGISLEVESASSDLRTYSVYDIVLLAACTFATSAKGRFLRRDAERAFAEHYVFRKAATDIREISDKRACALCSPFKMNERHDDAGMNLKRRPGQRTLLRSPSLRFPSENQLAAARIIKDAARCARWRNELAMNL